MKQWLIAAGCSAACLVSACWALFALIGPFFEPTRWWAIGSLILLLFAAGTIYFYNKLDEK